MGTVLRLLCIEHARVSREVAAGRFEFLKLGMSIFETKTLIRFLHCYRFWLQKETRQALTSLLLAGHGCPFLMQVHVHIELPNGLLPNS